MGRLNRGAPAVLLALVTAIVVTTTLQAQSANDLFQKALSKERVEGQPEAAIALYQRIVAEFSGDRALVAKALLQLGRAYERLGRSGATAAYARILRDFADQQTVVEEARARLAALPPPSGAPMRDQPSTSPRLRRLWEGQAAGQFLGSPSPDGRYVSMVDWTTLNLTLVEPGSGAPRPLTTSGANSGGTPYWSRISPDGTKVAFTFFRTAASADLRLVHIGDPTVRILYRNEDVDYIQPFDWSPDGERLLVVLAMPDRTHRIALVSVADGATQVLKSLDWRQPFAMSFSPDGRWIAYDVRQAETGRERDVMLLAVDGTRETRLVEHPADDFLLGWIPERATVLFASDRTGVPGAWAIDVADGQAVTPPTFVRGELGSRVIPMGFSRAGAFFYFIESTFSDLYTATLQAASGTADGVAAVPGRYSGTYQSGDWSADGRQLALVVNRGGLPDRRLVVRQVDTAEERELRPDLAMFNWPRWSSDGRSILVSGEDRRNRKGYFRVDATTGQLSELLREQPGTSLHLRAEWSADGHSIFYVRKDPACTCVMRRDLVAGRDVEIDRMTPRSTLVLLAPSPDGRWIAVATRGDTRTEVRVIPLAGGVPRVIADGDDIRWFNFVTWTRDSRDVLLGRQTAGSSQVTVWRVPLSGGEPRRTGLSADSLRDLRIHPDGNRVLFASGQNKGELWVMENFLSKVAR